MFFKGRNIDQFHPKGLKTNSYRNLKHNSKPIQNNWYFCNTMCYVLYETFQSQYPKTEAWKESIITQF